MSRKAVKAAPPRTTEAVSPAATPVAPAPVGFIPKQSYNIAEAAAAAGLPRWTVQQACGSGKLRAKSAGRTYIILPADLQKWLEHLPDVVASESYRRSHTKRVQRKVAA